ncbi:MAG: 23S rRNA (uracil(1939)-C(5))-methyltransferase RlmD [Christensenellales bacterium]
MNKGDILQVEIVGTGMNGEGVARVEGKVVFVPMTLVGEKVKVEITDNKKAFASARVIKMIEPSPLRAEPYCPIYFQCGGCEMQHLQYKHQLAIKQEKVANCIKKECKLDISVLPTIASVKMLGYRNKIQLPVALVGGKIVVGYFKNGTHKVVPLVRTDNNEYGDCPLHDRQMQEIVDVFIQWANKNGMSVYDEKTHHGLLRHFCVRRVGQSYAIVVVVNGSGLPEYKGLIDDFVAHGLSFSLYLSINTDRTNVIYGKCIRTLYGNDTLPCEILGVKAEVSPLSFMQINDDVRDMIYSKVGEIISGSKHSVVFDLFSGVGIMSNIFARYADKVVGIEIVPDAVRNADKLATLNGNQDKITNVCADVTVALPKQIAKYSQDKLSDSIVVVDPPRKGCSADVIDCLLQAQPKQIIYVSCNPATLARDMAKLLIGYTIDFVQPYDMFPMTGHVETLVSMTIKDATGKKEIGQ